MGKTVICKNCGNEIWRDEARCPYCRKYRPPIQRYPILWIFTIPEIILLLYITLYHPFTQPGKTHSNEQTLPIPISTVELYDEYSKNEINADQKFKGKILYITGTVTDISRDVFSDNPCISLDSGDAFGFYPVYCFFSKSEENSLTELTAGDEISIVGKCTGVAVSCVQLTGCYIPE